MKHVPSPDRRSPRIRAKDFNRPTGMGRTATSFAASGGETPLAKLKAFCQTHEVV
jgi:hypothetical protein